MIVQYNQLGSWGFTVDFLRPFYNACELLYSQHEFSGAVINYWSKKFLQNSDKNRTRESYWPRNREIVFLVDELPLYHQQILLHRKLKEIKTQLIGIIQRLICAAEMANKWKKKGAKFKKTTRRTTSAIWSTFADLNSPLSSKHELSRWT